MKKNLIRRYPKMTSDWVYNDIKKALFNYYVLVRSDLKKHWKSLPKTARRDAGVALRYLEGVFNNPKKYFSRADTQGDWNNRAVEYAKENGIGPVDAFYIVHGPREQFAETVKNACYSSELYHDLYKLAGLIQNWEYDRTSNRASFRDNAQRFADEIKKTAQRTQQVVDIMDSNPLVRPLKQLAYNFQK